MQYVDAATSSGQIDTIRRKLIANARGNLLYADIWSIGINLALRITDLLSLTFHDVEGEYLIIAEGKTGKVRTIKINQRARYWINARRQYRPDDYYLFEVDTNRARDKPVGRISVSKAFKNVGEEIGIRLGTHSMRKTFGYAMHSQGAPIELVCKLLNHSSPAVTMRYIGIRPADVSAAYDRFAL